MQLATMAAPCFAVLVLFLIKQVLGVPGDAVMFMPPLEVRTMDMNSKMMPFFNPRFFPASQHLTPQQMQSPSMPQSDIEEPQMQPSSIQQQIMQQPIMQQPIMQQPPMHESMMQRPTMQKPILHHTSIQSTSPPIIEPVTSRPHERHNMTFDELVEVLNEISDRNKDTDEDEGLEMRSAGPGYGYPAPLPPPPSYAPPPAYPSYSQYPRPYSPPRPSYGPYAPPALAPAYQPSYTPAVHHHHTKIGKSDLISGLLKPVTTKVGSKVGGLIGIVLSLLGGSSGGLELAGFKSLIVDGIIKPLLIAKGGIKSLISKLAIPVIALLLINVEVLITIWWLWEECPQPTYAYPPAPPPPPAYHSY